MFLLIRVESNAYIKLNSIFWGAISAMESSDFKFHLRFHLSHMFSVLFLSYFTPYQCRFSGFVLILIVLDVLIKELTSLASFLEG